MKVLVTGATGFVGSHLSELLKERGHEVYALVRNPKKLEGTKLDCHIIKGDLNLESFWDWIDQLPEDLDAVIHTAGIVHSFNEEHFYNVNSLATKRLIDLLKRKYDRLKFVLISSLAASGPSLEGELRLEDHPPQPTSQYGKSKLEAEEHLQDLAPISWNKVIIRPPMVIGPRDPAILDFFKMVSSRVVILPGLDGAEKRYSFICVFDLIEAIYRATTLEEIFNETFFVAHPNTIYAKELVGQIELTLAKKSLTLKLPLPAIKAAAFGLNYLNKWTGIEARLTPDKLHELTPKAWICSGEKCQRILGLDYQWDLEKTIEATAKDYKARGWI